MGLQALCGNTDLLQEVMSFLSLNDLLVSRCINSIFHMVARETVRSAGWLAYPKNREALQLAFWKEADYTTRSFAHTVLADVFCLTCQTHVLASGGRDCRALCWNLKERSSSATQEYSAWRKVTPLVHAGPVLCIALHGDQCATGCEEGTVRLWSIRSGECVRDTSAHMRCAITGLEWLVLPTSCTAGTSSSEPAEVGEAVGLLSSGLDRSLRLWRTSGNLMCTQACSCRARCACRAHQTQPFNRLLFAHTAPARPIWCRWCRTGVPSVRLTATAWSLRVAATMAP